MLEFSDVMANMRRGREAELKHLSKERHFKQDIHERRGEIIKNTTYGLLFEICKVQSHL